jgi:hypothetical protein
MRGTRRTPWHLFGLAVRRECSRPACMNGPVLGGITGPAYSTPERGNSWQHLPGKRGISPRIHGSRVSGHGASPARKPVLLPPAKVEIPRRRSGDVPSKGSHLLGGQMHAKGYGSRFKPLGPTMVLRLAGAALLPTGAAAPAHPSPHATTTPSLFSFSSSESAVRG